MSLDTYQLILSKPADVYWCGWKSTTVQLQRAGWQCSVQHDPMQWGVSLSFLNEVAGIYMQTDHISMDVLAGDRVIGGFRAQQLDFRGLQFQVVKTLHNQTRIIGSPPDLNDWVAFDARPKMHEVSTRNFSLDDVRHFFRPIEAPEEKEIIVGPQSVDEALQLILKLQAGDQAALREKARDKPRRVHAQIVSLAA